MANVLLINPSYMGSYGGNKISVINPIFPILSLATIGAAVRHHGHKVRILDLSMKRYNFHDVELEINKFKPDICGITALTPNINQLIDMSILIKDISKQILVVGGGSHATALPEETLHESKLDAVFIGEGDYSFTELCNGNDFKSIQGLYYRDFEEIKSTSLRTPIKNLDELPFPAWDLYDSELYTKYISRLLVKNPPVTTIEFSRGCIFKCDYCASKMTMALGYRKKSPLRCAEEVEYLHKLGFREFMVADDIFTSDQKWAAEVCEAIIETGIKITWTCTNGIRVESANNNLFKKMKLAGCYRLAFGFESGNDTILKEFGKGGKATIEKGIKAVNLANKAKIETNGFFMLGLSNDTEKTMLDTIEFARKLPLQMLKFSITIAFPGTKMFNNYINKGMIRSYNWDDYHIYTSESLFAHDYLTYKTIQKYMKYAYRRAIIMNPSFILRRIIRGIRTGEFFLDLIYFLKFIFSPTTNKASNNYYALDRWPKWDFDNNKPSARMYQKVVNYRRTDKLGNSRLTP